MTEHDLHEHAGDGSYKWSALFVVVIGTFMVMLDSSIVNIAISKMMNVFGASLDDVKWILTAYTLTMGAIIPVTGFLGDTFGIKKLFIFALSVFTIGSFFCGFSWSNSAMIFFRIIQALGGGMIMPVGMSYIMQIFAVSERGKALGFWGIASMAAPAIGPTLGGYIIQYMDWRFIFYVNVPIGVFGVIFAGLLLKETTLKPYEGNFDFLGFFSSVLGLVSVLYVIGEGSDVDWGNVKYPLILVFGIFSLIIFIFNELTHPNPLLELRLFKIYNFTLSQLITSITSLAMMGGVYVLPLFLQSLRGYTAMKTGLTLFPSAIASGLMMPVSGTIFDKYGAKIVTIPGLIIVAIASYQMSMFNMSTTRETIMLVATLRGLGLGLSMMPVNTAAMNSVPRNLFSKASALSTTFRSISQALAVTFMTTIISNRSNYNYLRLSEQITPFNKTSSYLLKMLQALYQKSGLTQAASKAASIYTLTKKVYGQAYLDAMNYAVAVTVIAVFIAIILVLLMKENKKSEVKKIEIVQGNEEDIYESESGIAAFME